MPRGKSTWTPALIAEVLVLYGQTEPKLTRVEIAARVGVSFYALRAALVRHSSGAGVRPGWTRGRGRARRDDPGADPAGRESHVRHRLWCLGPVEPRHAFWSDDAKRVRVCQRCRMAMAGVFEEHAL